MVPGGMIGNKRLECSTEGSTSVLRVDQSHKKLKGMGRISSQSWAQNVAGKPLLIVPRTIVEQFYNVQCLKLSIFKLPIFLICCK